MGELRHILNSGVVSIQERRSMIVRNIKIVVLLAALVFTLSACINNRHLSGNAVIDAKLESDLKAIEDIRSALAALGADVDDIDDSNWAAMLQPETPNEPDNAKDYSEYVEMPVDILSMEKPGGNKFTGNRYYFNGCVMASGEFDGEFEYIDLYVDLEDNVHYKSMAIAGLGTEEGWSDIDLGDLITVYFQYIGYSDDIERQVGYFEHYESYSPF